MFAPVCVRLHMRVWICVSACSLVLTHTVISVCLSVCRSVDGQRRAEAYREQVAVAVREVDRLRAVVLSQQTDAKFKTDADLARALLGGDLTLGRVRNVQLSGILHKQSTRRFVSIHACMYVYV
jgi:hypothetical protein